MQFLLIYVFPSILGLFVFMIMHTTGTFFQWYHKTGVGIVTAIVFGAIMFTLMNPPQSANQEKSEHGSLEDKQDKLYDVMNHIRWILLGIGGLFVIYFIIPQCTGG